MYIRKFHSQGKWVKTPLLSYKCRSKDFETYRMVTTTTLNYLNTPQEYYSDPHCNLIFVSPLLFTALPIEIVVNLELAYNKKDKTNLEYKVITNRFINS